MIFSEEQNNKPAGQITVGNAVVAVQIIDRVVSKGGISGAELAVVADCRTAMTESIKAATDVEYDVAVAQAVAQAQAQQAQQNDPPQDATTENSPKASAKTKRAKK